MRRDLFTEEHELFRAQFRRFAEREIEPRVAQWNHDRITDRDTWRRMGAEGFLGPAMPEAYGGGGGDFLFDAIVMEELAWRRAHGLMTAVHSSICMPYLLSYGSEEQKQRWLPPAIRGETLLGICMTEPGTGSDLANVQTRAIRDGDHYVVNGSKTFISDVQALPHHRVRMRDPGTGLVGARQNPLRLHTPPGGQVPVGQRPSAHWVASGSTDSRAQ